MTSFAEGVVAFDGDIAARYSPLPPQYAPARERAHAPAVGGRAGSDPLRRTGIDDAAQGDRFVCIVVPIEALERVTRAIEADADAPAAAPREVARYRFSGWSFWPRDRKLAAPGGGVFRVRPAEAALLGILLARPRRTLARAAVAEWMRTPGGMPLSARSIDSYVCRLRALFRRAGHPGMIATVRATGYWLESEVARD